MAQAFESLGLYYEWRGRFQEGERAFARAAESLGQVDSSDRWIPLARARVWQARFSRGLGRGRDARSWIPETLALVERLDPTEHDVRPERADILNELGHLSYDAGDQRGASFWYEHSLALCREMNDRWRQARVLLAIESIHRNLHGLGNAEEHLRQTQEAQRLVMESLTIFRALGDHANMAAALHALGVTFLTLGQPKDAQPVFVECIALCNELHFHGDTSSTPSATWESRRKCWVFMRRCAHTDRSFSHWPKISTIGVDCV
jgi:tetratricopeptide (TPR) repeat protein